MEHTCRNPPFKTGQSLTDGPTDKLFNACFCFTVSHKKKCFNVLLFLQQAEGWTYARYCFKMTMIVLDLSFPVGFQSMSQANLCFVSPQSMGSALLSLSLWIVKVRHLAFLPPLGSQTSHAAASQECQLWQSWHSRRNRWGIWWRCDESPAPWSPSTHIQVNTKREEEVLQQHPCNYGVVSVCQALTVNKNAHQLWQTQFKGNSNKIH